MGIFASIARKNEEEAKDRRLQSETKKNESETKRLEAEAKLVKVKSEQDRKTMNLQASIQERIMAAEEKARIAQEKRDEARDKTLREEQKQMEERLRREQTQMQERLSREQAEREERLRREFSQLITDLQNQIRELQQRMLECEQTNSTQNRILANLRTLVCDMPARYESLESQIRCLAMDVQLIREDFQGNFDRIGDQLLALDNEVQQIRNEGNRVPALENVPMLEMQPI